MIGASLNVFFTSLLQKTFFPLIVARHRIFQRAHCHPAKELLSFFPLQPVVAKLWAITYKLSVVYS